MSTKLYGVAWTHNDGEGDGWGMHLRRTKEKAIADMRSEHEECFGAVLPEEPNPKGFYVCPETEIAYHIVEYELED